MQGPGVLRTLFRTIRGYRGGITPAAALDCVCNEGNTVIVDIRTDRCLVDPHASRFRALYCMLIWLLLLLLLLTCFGPLAQSQKQLQLGVSVRKSELRSSCMSQGEGQLRRARYSQQWAPDQRGVRLRH